MQRKLLTVVSLSLGFCCLVACGSRSEGMEDANDTVSGDTTAGQSSSGSTTNTGMSSSSVGPTETDSSSSGAASSSETTEDGSESTEGMVVPDPTVLRAIILTAGPSWNPELPPEEQDLAGHFAYVGGLFESGVLLANGPFLDDGRGLYLYLASETEDTRALLAEDPAIESGVLAFDEMSLWSLALEQLGAEVEDMAFFVLEYQPGPAWDADLPIDMQAGFEEHLGHVGAGFEDQHVLAAGLVSDEHGRYLVVFEDAEAGEAWTLEDPGVQAELFSVTVRPWQPLQRQSPT